LCFDQRHGQGGAIRRRLAAIYPFTLERRPQMRTVNDLLRTKGHTIWSIAPEATVYTALELMAQKDVGALLVLDNGNLIGILSERDYARKIVLKGKTSRDTLVREIMTEHVVYVRPSQTVEECMALMTSKRVRHLPVMEDRQLIGVISIGDVVKAIISEQEFLIEQLENYITGKR
jgi:signal-transduction protein with cAMP-binding, CBS, and nucleotidyltransferase domain